MVHDFSAIMIKGKNLTDSLTDFIMENSGINDKLDTFKQEFILKEELPTHLEDSAFVKNSTMEETKQEIERTIEAMNDKILETDV